ncbi:hypothetical protein [Actinomadura macrotermitis]|uniref:Small secreted protein n=1 Tax=Actinomadura macrotermitis TaxID=2585200 RepID=A0A7K0BV69_9ACTN|nr:hypothetical protein [Actinomadura macrotermitis]MQY05085.1 hypothetical protein [Actinomadura macrotermitis]
MRMSAAKIVGALAIGGAVLGSTACGPLDAVAGGDKKTACNNIKTELTALGDSGSATGLGGAGANAAAKADKFAAAASKIRSEGQKAGGDVETSATALAGDLDKTADTLRSLSSGRPSAGGMNSLTQMAQHGQELGKACGYQSNFRFGS